jgi:hypothetical protein
MRGPMAIDFKAALEQELKHISKENGLSSDKAFLVWFMTAILEIDEDAALEGVGPTESACYMLQSHDPPLGRDSGESCLSLR